MRAIEAPAVQFARAESSFSSLANSPSGAGGMGGVSYFVHEGLS